VVDVELEGLGVALLLWVDVALLADGVHTDALFHRPLNQARAWLCTASFAVTSPTSRLSLKDTTEKFWEPTKVADGVMISLAWTYGLDNVRTCTPVRTS
jgi:hypothetical protein